MRLTDTLGGGYRIQMGISKVWKPVVYQIFSIWASSYFLLGGCPLSVALFTAGYANGYGRGWYLLFMAGSLFLRVPVLTALRYSFAMGVVLLVGEWTGRRKSCRDKWVLSLAGAMAVLGLFFVLSYMKGTLIQDYGNILVQAGIIFAVSDLFATTAEKPFIISLLTSSMSIILVFSPDFSIAFLYPVIRS